MNNHEPRKNPFAFRPSPEVLKQFRDASPEAKLNWLEEANRFVNEFVSPSKLEKWKKWKRAKWITGKRHLKLPNSRAKPPATPGRIEKAML